MKTINVNEHAFKRASKTLASLSADKPLSACHNAVAQATGYRDYHHYKATLGAGDPTPQTTADDRVAIIHSLSSGMNMPHGDVLHALSTARFFGNQSDLEDALNVRTRLFAAQYPLGKTLTTGAPCVLRGKGGQRALFVSGGQGGQIGAQIYTDYYLSSCMDYELKPSPAAAFFIPLRFWMPYGFWTEKDGSKVIFSRDYCPMWKISGTAAPVRDDPDRAVHKVAQEWFFGGGELDGTPEEIAKKGLKVLSDHRVVSMPKLVERLPTCLETGTALPKLKVWPDRSVAAHNV